jgi:hypothetical protein
MLYIYFLLAVLAPSILFGADDLFIVPFDQAKHANLITDLVFEKFPTLFPNYEKFTPAQIDEKKEKFRIVLRTQYHMDWSINTAAGSDRWVVGYNNNNFIGFANYAISADNKWSGDKKGGYLELIELVNYPDSTKIELFRAKLIAYVCEQLKAMQCAQVNTYLSPKDYAAKERETYKVCGFIEKTEDGSILAEKQLN